jgi:hypothetical protein
MTEASPIALSRLKKGEWYVGQGWGSLVARWDGEFFTSVTATGEMILLGYGRDTQGFTPHRMVL